jgi:serine phosphatase RsbU (regulator of sigma subunit)
MMQLLSPYLLFFTAAIPVFLVLLQKWIFRYERERGWNLLLLQVFVLFSYECWRIIRPQGWTYDVASDGWVTTFMTSWIVLLQVYKAQTSEGMSYSIMGFKWVFLALLLHSALIFSWTEYVYWEWWLSLGLVVSTVLHWLLVKYITQKSHVGFHLVFFLLGVYYLLPNSFFRILWLIGLARIFLHCLNARVQVVRGELQSLRAEKSIVSRMMVGLSKRIRDMSDVRESLDEFLISLMSAVDAKGGVVYTFSRREALFYPRSVQGYFFPLHRDVSNVFAKRDTLVEMVMTESIGQSDHPVWICGETAKSIFIPFVNRKGSLQKNHQGLAKNGIQTLLVIPMLIEREIMGVVVLQNKSYDRYYTINDLSVAETFSHHGALLIHNAQTYSEKAEQERVTRELEIARRIQEELIPNKSPTVAGLQIISALFPARELGGDYYDFINYDERYFSFLIGDVSGKGIPASIIMSMVQTLVHAHIRHCNNTQELMVLVNQHLSRKLAPGHFMSMLLFRWDTLEHKMVYTSCGHEHILIYRSLEHRLDCYKSGGLALGMVEDISPMIRERKLDLNMGDTVMLYTDGVTEARAPDGSMFGLEKLKQVFTRYHALQPEDFRKEILREIQVFTRGAEQSDDITFLIFRRI